MQDTRGLHREHWRHYKTQKKYKKMDKGKKMEIPFSDDMRLEVYENGILEIVHNIDGKSYSATLHNKAFLSKLRSTLKVKRGEMEDVFVELKKMMGVPKDLYTPSNE